MGREHGRLAFALLLSLLIHALLLSLTFGGQGLGLPGFAFPWRDRRIEAPELRVVLGPTHVTAEEAATAPVAQPLQLAPIGQRVASASAATPSMSPAPRLRGMTAAIRPAPEVAAEAQSERSAVAGAAPTEAPARIDVPGRTAPERIVRPAVVEAAPSDVPASVVPAAPSKPTPVIAVPPSVPSPETVPQEAARVELARREAELQEAPRLTAAPLMPQRQETARQEQEAARELARREAELQEAPRLTAAPLVPQRQETARQEQEAARELARREAELQEVPRLTAAPPVPQRQEIARQEQEAVRELARREAELPEAPRLAAVATQTEAQRQEVARNEREAARVELARQEAERQEGVRREAERQEAARREAERQEAARREGERQEAARARAEEEAKREARLRAIGRQLDEEAAQREESSNPARQSSTLPFSLSTARRVRLWGRADPNVELIHYAEAWERKIQLNTPEDTVRDLAKRLHNNPMVTVAIRRDGSVESVTFVLSTGTPEVDAAIRSIVQSQRYDAFPPELASEYDVIEIRRTWSFDRAIRFY